MPTPTEEQIEYLSRLGVAEPPAEQEEAARLIKRLADPLAEAVRQAIPTFYNLGSRVLREAVVAVRQAPEADAIYKGQKVDADRLMEILAAELDEEYIAFLELKNLHADRILGAREYIRNFAEYAHDLQLDDDTARELTARSFAREIGQMLGPELQIIEDRVAEVLTHKDVKNQQDAYRKLYRRPIEANRNLTRLFQEQGVLGRGGGPGCALPGAGLIVLGLAGLAGWGWLLGA